MTGLLVWNSNINVHELTGYTEALSVASALAAVSYISSGKQWS